MLIARQRLLLCLTICANIAFVVAAHSAPSKQAGPSKTSAAIKSKAAAKAGAKADKAPLKETAPKPAEPQEIVIDSVVASVDDNPIMLSELNARLTPPRRITRSEVGKDQAALMALDGLIMERLVEAEAAAKRVFVSDAELEDYLQEVARRNGLSKAEFEAALTAQGQDIKTYRQQIKVDILKTKLAGSISRGGISVSESEIDDYLASSNPLTQSGASIRLRHILINAQGRDQGQIQERVAQVISALETGEEFKAVAARLSDGPHAAEGGLIGTLAETDLSSEVREAVAPLQPGSYTAPLTGDNGVQFFFIEERFAESSAESENREADIEARRAEARRILQQQKTQTRLSSYFIGELYKNHAVEKKI